MWQLCLMVVLGAFPGCTCSKSHAPAEADAMAGADASLDAHADAPEDARSDAAVDASADASIDAATNVADAGASGCDGGGDAGCVLALVEGDGGPWWICFDPARPDDRSGDMPFDCGPELVKNCRREEMSCTLGPVSCSWEQDCECQGPLLPSCECALPDQECTVDQRFGCAEYEGLPLECGIGEYPFTACGGTYYDTSCVDDIDCVPEPCTHPTVCVNSAEATCRHPDSCADDGMCHVPISCECRLGGCITTYEANGCL